MSEAFDIEQALSQIGSRVDPVVIGNAAEGNIERLLMDMLGTSQEGRKSIPCLCGLSGVAKSSIVKKVANS